MLCTYNRPRPSKWSSQFVFGGEFVFGARFVFGEFVFGVENSSSGRNLSSGNSSLQFIFGGEINLPGTIRLRGIRLRNSSSGGILVFGEFVFAIRLRGGNSSSGNSSSGNSSSGNSSSEGISGNSCSQFVFGGESVFAAQFVFGEFVFAIRLRGEIIRLRGAVRLRGIRLRPKDHLQVRQLLPP